MLQDFVFSCAKVLQPIVVLECHQIVPEVGLMSEIGQNFRAKTEVENASIRPRGYSRAT